MPANESQRLAAVRSLEILDTGPEVDFDVLTRLATHTFEVPAAVVGLMDADRLWFKSRVGLDVPQLDRQMAFCAFAVMKPEEVLVVDDLKTDPRFRDNPLVTKAPNARFYAGAPIVDHNGLALGTIAIIDMKPRDLSERERTMLRDLSVLVMRSLEQRRASLHMARLAMTDFLTRLANRAQFTQALSAEVSHANRTGDPLAVLCMDLNRFKSINDTYGHPTGDEVLVEVADRIQQVLRQEDLAARLGGDEFGIIMRNATASDAKELTRRIMQAVSAPITLYLGKRVSVGISIGAALYRRTEETADELLIRADVALYDMKRKNRI